MPRKRSIVDSQEPDPIDDGEFALQLERESIKSRIRDEISRGAANFNKIIARFHDLTELYTKDYVAEIIKEVRAEIMAELMNRDVSDEVLTFLEENDYLIEEAHSVLSSGHTEPKDKIAALKAVSGLRQQRIDFLKYYGALPKDGWNDVKENEKTAANDKETKFLERKHAEAAAIEARVK